MIKVYCTTKIQWNPVFSEYFLFPGGDQYKQSVILPHSVNFDLVNNRSLVKKFLTFQNLNFILVWPWLKQQSIFKFSFCQKLLMHNSNLLQVTFCTSHVICHIIVVLIHNSGSFSIVLTQWIIFHAKFSKSQVMLPLFNKRTINIIQIYTKLICTYYSHYVTYKLIYIN